MCQSDCVTLINSAHSVWPRGHSNRGILGCQILRCRSTLSEWKQSLCETCWCRTHLIPLKYKSYKFILIKNPSCTYKWIMANPTLRKNFFFFQNIFSKCYLFLLNYFQCLVGTTSYQSELNVSWLHIILANFHSSA